MESIRGFDRFNAQKVRAVTNPRIGIRVEKERSNRLWRLCLQAAMRRSSFAKRVCFWAGSVSLAPGEMASFGKITGPRKGLSQKNDLKPQIRCRESLPVER